MESTAQGGNAIPCPDEQLWLEIAAGLAEPGKSTRMLDHAAVCPDCAITLKRCLLLVDDETGAEERSVIQSLPSSQPEWQRSAAASLTSRQATPWPRTPLPRTGRWVWMAAAAAMLVLGAGLLWNRWRIEQPPLALLAQAYSQHRTLDLRILGARPAPISVTRGSTSLSALPPELSESNALIRRHLDRHPEDPAWLRAEGLASLLAGQFNDAIPNLQLAFQLDSQAPPSRRAADLMDLATGYFERAEALNRAVDYSMAEDRLGQAIQLDPSLSEAYFNRAIVEERLFHYQSALDDWDRYLRADPKGSWAAEARERQAALRKKMQGAHLGEPGRLDDMAEYRLEQAMQAGLTSSDAATVAAEMRQRHADSWLWDALASPGREAAGALAAMVRSRALMQVEKFGDELRTLRQLPRGLADPYRVWLEFESVYRVARSPLEARCVPGLDDTISLARRRGYAWMETQLVLERSSCELAEGHFDRAEADARDAVDLAARHDLPSARLRAAGFLSSRLANAGRYRETAALDLASLEVFWSRPFPYLHGQQFYNDMMWTGEGLKRWHSAAAAARMAVSMAKLAGADATEAVNRARWALFSERAGFGKEAAHEAAASSALFAGIPRNPISDGYRAFSVAVTVQQTGDRSALESMAQDAGSSTNPMVAAPYWRAVAVIDERDGRVETARADLKRAIDALGAPKIPSRPVDARQWQLEMDRATRQLVRLDVDNGRAVDAYRLWQSFLAWSDTREGGLSALSHSLRGEPATQLSYIRTEKRYGVWIRDRDRIAFRWLAEDAGEIDRLVQMYLALCARPESNLPAVDALGTRLRASLFDPAQQQASGAAVFLIQADGELASLPWEALPLSGGRPIGERYTISAAPLAASLDDPVEIQRVAANNALIVEATDIDPSLASELLPLPGLDREMETVLAAFPGARLLRGFDATAANIDREARTAGAFHFAGHAVATPEGVALAVSGGLWKPHQLSHFGLAVISACSGARYEESESPEPHHLAHALLLLGARQVVAAHWNTDSNADSEFMRIFYGGLRNGASVARAVRAASGYVRKQPSWRHPYYWAAFSTFVRT